MQMLAVCVNSYEIRTLFPSSKMKLNKGSSVASLGSGGVPQNRILTGSSLVPFSSSKTYPHPSSPVRSRTVAIVEQPFCISSSEHRENKSVAKSKAAIGVFIKECRYVLIRHNIRRVGWKRERKDMRNLSLLHIQDQSLEILSLRVEDGDGMVRWLRQVMQDTDLASGLNGGGNNRIIKQLAIDYL